QIFRLDGTGLRTFLYPNGLVALEGERDAVQPAQPCFVDISGRTNVLIRFQRDVAQQRASCEVWNYDGTGYGSQVLTITSTVPYTVNGGYLGGGATTALGFVRVFTSVLPLGSKPPTTADAGNWTELKLNNNLSDSSGGGHNASITGATFMSTPNQVAI